MSKPEEYFEVRSELKDNPYIAHVMCDPSDQDAERLNDYYSGHLAIQPPVALSKEFLESVIGDVKVELVPLISTQYSSLFRFQVPDSGSFSHLSTRERVEITVQQILDTAGEADSLKSLKKMYKRK